MCKIKLWLNIVEGVVPISPEVQFLWMFDFCGCSISPDQKGKTKSPAKSNFQSNRTNPEESDKARLTVSLPLTVRLTITYPVEAATNCPLLQR